MLRWHAAHSRSTRCDGAYCDEEGRDSLAHYAGVTHGGDVGLLAGTSDAPKMGTDDCGNRRRPFTCTRRDRRARLSGNANDLWRRNIAGRSNGLERCVKEALTYG